MKKLSVGIIGLGNISTVHIRALQNHPAVTITAVADTDLTLLKSKAADISTSRPYADYHNLLAQPGIQFVDILLPHFLHARVIREALVAGKHVLCEKPLVTEASDIAAIAAAAKKFNKRVYPKQYFQFSRLHRKVRDELLAGVIGKPYFISCTYTTDDSVFYDNPYSWRGTIGKAGGGVWMDVGIHIVDYLTDMFGFPLAVSAVMKHNFSYLKSKGEDLSVVTLEFAGNVTATIACTARDTSYGFRWEKHFYGSDGSVHLVDAGKLRMDMSVQKDRRVVLREKDMDWWEHANIDAINDVIDRIIRDEPAGMNLSEARRLVGVIQAAYTSARLRKTVVL